MVLSHGLKRSILGTALISLGLLFSLNVTAAPNLPVTSATSHSVGTTGVTAPTEYLYQYSQQNQAGVAGVKSLEHKCTEGEADACKALGYENIKVYHQDHDVKFIQKGFSFFERGCALRDKESCYLRGLTIIEGQQHNLDVKEVFSLNNVEDMVESSLLEGAKLSNSKQASDAFAFLAEIYQDKDYNKAINYASQGCDLHNNDACYLKGLSLWVSQIEGKDVSKYLHGRDVFDVTIEAFKWGTQANRLEYCSNSYYFLGYEYARKKMYDESTLAYKKGCDLNNDNACFFTGIAYEDGLGVFKDIQTAYNYFTKACNLGSSYGCERVRKLNLQGIH